MDLITQRKQDGNSVTKISADSPVPTGSIWGAAIDDGNLFRAGCQKDLNASSGIVMLSITTPASPVLRFVPAVVSAEAECRVQFIEGPDGIADGTEVTPRNADRNSSAASSASVKYDPTVTIGGGVVLGNVVLGNGRAVGGSITPSGEWLLKPSTTYVLLVENKTTSKNQISIRFYWKE